MKKRHKYTFVRAHGNPEREATLAEMRAGAGQRCAFAAEVIARAAARRVRRRARPQGVYGAD